MKCFYQSIFFFLALFLFHKIPALGQPGWISLNSGTSYHLKAVYPLNYNYIYATGEGARILKSSDAGNSWQDISPAFASVNFNDLVFFDSLTGVVVGDNGTFLRTTDGGGNWLSIPGGIGENLFSISFSDSSGICGGSSQSILNSADRGATWTIAQSGFFGGGFWGTHMLTSQIGYVVGENSIFQPLMGKTIDGGINWNFFPFYLNNNEGRAYGVQFTDINIGYAACRVWGGRGAMAKSTDGGSSWNSSFFNSPLYSVSFPISNTGLVGYAVGESGLIIKTTDAGNSWQSQMSGTSQRLNDVSFLDFDYGFAAGNMGTILKTESGGEPPILIDPPTSVNIQEFMLLGNYPNPFNPATVIRYQLSTDDHVYLKIYDLRGIEIATLIDGQIPAGKHQVSWSAGNLAGGIYFYTLQVKNKVQSGKMVLLK
ncbi:MAG: T9SS type A sorting domain-containing protein [bacterium]|nr:MAG: T9SS type A sorting domain-containing protein [bacterium]